jgi:RNA polymerase sigma-70 factor (ECF subfamily)
MEWNPAIVCPTGDMAAPMTSTDLRSDDELVAGSRAGDERAFAQLIRRYQARVERIVVRMLGPGDDAEDVAQETFIRLHRGLDGFRGESAIGTYVSRIAINLSLNALRRRRWQLRRFIRRDVEPEARRDEPMVEVTDTVVAEERSAALAAALDRLGDRHRAVVVLRLLEEYSTRETAEMLQIPEGTVMSRLTRALQKLQQDLRASGLEAP